MGSLSGRGEQSGWGESSLVEGECSGNTSPVIGCLSALVLYLHCLSSWLTVVPTGRLQADKY